MNRRIKLNDCKQVRSDLPIFEGRCSDNGDVLQVIESGWAIEGMRISYNRGLLKGIVLGTAAACVGIATAWTLNKMFTSDKDED